VKFPQLLNILIQLAQRNMKLPLQRVLMLMFMLITVSSIVVVILVVVTNISLFNRPWRLTL